MEFPDNRRKADDSYQASRETPVGVFCWLRPAPRESSSLEINRVQTLQGYLIVFLGAGVGGMVRHGVNRVALLVGSTFPWNTLAINITGCFVMGLTAGWFAFKGDSSQSMRLFLTTGILGGYTTFSAFSLDAALLWDRGDGRGAFAYVATSVVVSLFGVFAGLVVMRR